ncbi:hypothetical protein D9611_013242 [Ephemerocybe angulata]|uniref:G-protein coupled receptors family 1 profile domain-containing protein n=1 Tax=Ephemerocybe angulata TaxID=980116 RepID=A0A8H5CCC0_9AGAR|nr:hypothetical protein D9611_013242 [Tulosesus angulatus]
MGNDGRLKSSGVHAKCVAFRRALINTLPEARDELVCSRIGTYLTMSDTCPVLDSPSQICTLAELDRVARGDHSIHCLSRGQAIGLSVVLESGLVSLIAVLYVFGIIIRNVIRRVRQHRRWLIFVDPIDVIMFSLFLADLIQSIGAVLNAKWVSQGKVEVGEFCTAQGVIKQLGETTAAMSTLLITIYTFRGLWLGIQEESLRVTKIYWCWIGSKHFQWKIWGEYIWFWVTLGFSIVTYVPLFFEERGVIVLDPNSSWGFRFRRGQKATGNSGGQSMVMLAYPVVYSISIVPLSVTRWIAFVREGKGVSMVDSLPSGANLACMAIHGLSGVANVVLLLTTRPNTPLFRKDIDGTSPVLLPAVAGNVPVHQGHGANSPTAESDTKTITTNGATINEVDYELGRLPSR